MPSSIRSSRRLSRAPRVIFFIEEMLQALFDEGALVRNGPVKVTRPLAQVRLPSTVQGIVAARIDRQPADAGHRSLLLAHNAAHPYSREQFCGECGAELAEPAGATAPLEG